MLRIGLTGGIASGKSAAARRFEQLGVPVIDTDQVARDVVQPGTSALACIVDAFGPGALGPDGQLDRRAMRARIFADDGAKKTLESIVHPAIHAEVARRLDHLVGPYAVIAIPLLVEGGRRIPVDRVLLIDCRPETQLARLLARDGETPVSAAAILKAQATRAARQAVADDLIENEGSLTELEQAVTALDTRYRALTRPPSAE
jgi:dephospho-CoA kinase